MIHFRDYEEYQKVRKLFPDDIENTETEEVRKTELVLEGNTIYEIDVNCEKCLKQLWRKKDER